MFLGKAYKIKNYFTFEKNLILLGMFCAAYALYIALKYANQVPLDHHSFRQTHTALTSFWLVKNGFSFAYETPVAGPPWSIPFEFPIYQYIVALVSERTNYSLDATGRAVSFLFLALCLIPVRVIIKNLGLSSSVFYIFTALLFSSPLYLYWGRTFMIETTAVFFSVAAIKYFIDLLKHNHSFKHALLFLILISLSILQKATTGLPVLAIMCCVYGLLIVKEAGSLKRCIYNKKTFLAFVYFGVPLVIGITWTLYTDQIKALNSLGVSLTSSELTQWNWGTLNQRLSFDLYREVILKRIFMQNISGALGIAILLIGLFSNANKSIIAVSILMGLVPLFLFTNLHIVHTYYQTANVIFLIFAIAVSLGNLLNYNVEKKIIVLAITLVMVVSNYFWFSVAYLAVTKTEYTRENSRDFGISEILKREIPVGKYFVAFGNNWSSTFSYLSERKSFTVPGFFKEYEKIVSNPERFIDINHLGGIVICSHFGNPTINDLSRWSAENRNWKIGEVHGCFIGVPGAAPVDKFLKPFPSVCQGNIDLAVASQVENHSILSVVGWTTVSGEDGIVPDRVYVTLTHQNNEPVYFEALQVIRPDVNTYFGHPNDAYSGFSRVINIDSFSGEYVVSLARLDKGRLETCQFQNKVLLNGMSNSEQ